MTTTQSQATATPGTQDSKSPAAPATIQRKVGSTVYTVSIHFSETGKESLEDKILKLIKREVSGSA